MRLSTRSALVMHHALSLSIIRGRGDVVTRFILLLSADAYAMQLCKQGLGGHKNGLFMALILRTR